MESFKMWDNTPEVTNFEPTIEYYKSQNKTTDSTIIIFPGGGYGGRTPHEGKDYAEFLNSFGMDAFVVQYRVYPNCFPLPLLDARRSVRWVRKNAEKFGINPQKIGVIGSSAGGHLVAMLSTYRDAISFEKEDEIDNFDYIPNFQVLCYPVICISDLKTTHVGSCFNLLGNNADNLSMASHLDPALIADKKTPKAFIWHTANDNVVNVKNSLRYGERLRDMEIPFEMHIFPDGPHGLGLADTYPHVAQWTGLFINWLKDNALL